MSNPLIKKWLLRLALSMLAGALLLVGYSLYRGYPRKPPGLDFQVDSGRAYRLIHKYHYLSADHSDIPPNTFRIHLAADEIPEYRFGLVDSMSLRNKHDAMDVWNRYRAEAQSKGASHGIVRMSRFGWANHISYIEFSFDVRPDGTWSLVGQKAGEIWS